MKKSLLFVLVAVAVTAPLWWNWVGLIYEIGVKPNFPDKNITSNLGNEIKKPFINVVPLAHVQGKLERIHVGGYEPASVDDYLAYLKNHGVTEERIVDAIVPKGTVFKITNVKRRHSVNGDWIDVFARQQPPQLINEDVDISFHVKVNDGNITLDKYVFKWQ